MVDREKTRLLVVEDDGLIRLDLVDILQDAGYAVTEAANADEAIRILDRATDFAAILTDIDMPGSMNGLGLARHAHQRRPDCKLVIISGRYKPEEDALPSGARFLTKPVSDAVIGKLLGEMGVRA